MTPPLGPSAHHTPPSLAGLQPSVCGVAGEADWTLPPPLSAGNRSNVNGEQQTDNNPAPCVRVCRRGAAHAPAALVLAAGTHFVAETIKLTAADSGLSIVAAPRAGAAPSVL